MGPRLHCFNLGRIHLDAIRTDDESQILNFCFLELAFFQFEVETRVCQLFQYSVDMLSVFFPCI